jgi:hypothetical protein
MYSLSRSALVLLAVLVCASSAAAQQPDPEFTKARQARADAIRTGDKATFDRLTTANFTATGPTGTLETREQRVGRADKPQGGGGAPATLEEERISVYGDTVVLNWKQGNNRFLEVWVKDRGTWKCAGVQITPIQQRPQ